MKFFVLGSMQFSEQMIETRDRLRELGHEAVTSKFVEAFIGKNDAEKERIKLGQKNQEDAMRVDCAQIPGVDAVLVMNLEKHGIPGYIGGNVLIELGYSHILDKKIYLWNPVPEIKYYQAEIEAMKPMILNCSLENL